MELWGVAIYMIYDVIKNDSLSFSQHVKKILHKAALKVNALRCQSKWLDQDVKLPGSDWAMEEHLF